MSDQPNEPEPGTGKRKKRPVRGVHLRVVDFDDPALPAWMRDLKTGLNGTIAKTFGNVCKILRHTQELWYDEMRLSPMLGDLRCSDADIGRLREELFPRYGLELGKDMVTDAIVRVADEQRRHPVREYLRSLKWDGKPYIERLPHHVLGIPAPTPLHLAMMRRWAISAVARVMRPGCKVDTSLVLVGKQGARKSTFFAVLASGEWFSDSPMVLTNKDAAMQLFAAWIYEWPEIDKVTLGRFSASEVKAFLSQYQDTIRKPYARSVTVEPRHTVVVGSTNVSEYLNDETGSRRFWTIEIPDGARIDLDQLRAWRDQVWAEAVAAFDAGEPWWLTAEEDVDREDAAAKHAIEDPTAALIQAWLDVRPPRLHDDGIGLLDVMSGALKLEPKELERSKHHVTKAMKSLGYTVKLIGKRRERRWFQGVSGVPKESGVQS